MSMVTPFEGTQVMRSLRRHGEPWFVAVDVCRCLGLTNSRQALAVLDDDEKGVTLSDTPGGRQEVAVISAFAYAAALQAQRLRRRAAALAGAGRAPR